MVTTYQTLAADRGKEVNHPLAQVEWFRIVLDEAHMAKSAATAQSKACFELRAARRWACTGTPMGTDIVDLQGQLMFLGAFPAMQKNVFENWFRGRALQLHSIELSSLAECHLLDGLRPCPGRVVPR